VDLIEVVKAMLVPGSASFLLLGLTVGLALILASLRTRRWGIAWLTILAATYWLLSLPATASFLEGALIGDVRPLQAASAAPGAQAIVVLGGGSETFRAEDLAVSAPSEPSALRALEAARVYGLVPTLLVIPSGGPGGVAGLGEPESTVMRRVLEANGIPTERIVEEALASSTREEALALGEILAERGVSRVIVVTSPTHMRRALGALAAVGIAPIGSPSREHSESRPAVGALLPSERALGDSRQALREVMALIYYAARGWLAPVPTP
jgi:uncharacterized SAM-binding protein YcdF (DUF218 family)